MQGLRKSFYISDIASAWAREQDRTSSISPWLTATGPQPKHKSRHPQKDKQMNFAVVFKCSVCFCDVPPSDCCLSQLVARASKLGQTMQQSGTSSKQRMPQLGISSGVRNHTQTSHTTEASGTPILFNIYICAARNLAKA